MARVMVDLVVDSRMCHSIKPLASDIWMPHVMIPVLQRRRGELMKRQKKQTKEERGKENMLEDAKDTKELSVKDFPSTLHIK